MAERTPAVTTGDSVGAGTVVAFLALASVDNSDTVKLAAIVAATIVAGLTVFASSRVRVARNLRAALKEN